MLVPPGVSHHVDPIELELERRSLRFALVTALVNEVRDASYYGQGAERARAVEEILYVLFVERPLREKFPAP